MNQQSWASNLAIKQNESAEHILIQQSAAANLRASILQTLLGESTKQPSMIK